LKGTAVVELTELTATIVAAFVEGSKIATEDLPALIRNVHGALRAAATPAMPGLEPSMKATAAEIRRSLANPAFIISFIDHKPYKTLRRHITTNGMTIAQYLETFGLPKDYPLVSQASSRRRSQIALEMGLGRKKTPELAKAKAARKPKASMAISPSAETSA
jgi:predicted transcriptional regulator